MPMVPISTAWVDGDKSTMEADDCFHAGIAKNLIRGNMINAHENSYFDASMDLHQTLMTGSPLGRNFSGTEYVDEYNFFPYYLPLFVPLRSKTGDSTFRTITVEMEGKISTGTITIKGYLDIGVLAICRNNGLDSTDGVKGVQASNRVDLSFNSTSYAFDSDTIIAPASTSTPANCSGNWLVFIFQLSAQPAIFTGRSLRIYESAI